MSLPELRYPFYNARVIIQVQSITNRKDSNSNSGIGNGE